MRSGVLIAIVVALSVPAMAKPVETYVDPVTYCRAVGTADMPFKDHRWRGPMFPNWMVRVLNLQPVTDGSGNVRYLFEWRCMDRAVLACVELNNPICGKTSLNRKPGKNMRAWCRNNPNTNIPNAAMDFELNAYWWTCAGTTPRISPQTRLPSLDRRGYDPALWRTITPDE